MAHSSGSKEWLKRVNVSRFCRQTQRRVATFRLNDLVDLGYLRENSTAAAYSGCELSVITPQQRGHILEDVGRMIYQRHFPNSNISDPIPGYKCDGTRRSKNQAECDWMCDEARVQCKSAQLIRNQNRDWRCSFSGIKPGMLDELFLVLYTPSKLDFICHDGHTGLKSDGSRTAPLGCRLNYYVPINIACPHLAKSWILRQMERQSCRIIDSLSTSSEEVVQKVNSLMQSQKHQLERKAFEHHPLEGNSPTRRGLIIQDIVQKVDQLHHSTMTASESKAAPFDWRRGDLRVECKHTRMAWCKSSNFWFCRFSAVKMDCFDVLCLAVDTPAGIYVLQFHGSKYVTRNGVSDECTGKLIQIYGQRNETRWWVALDEIMNKLTSAGSEHVALVKW